MRGDLIRIALWEKKNRMQAEAEKQEQEGKSVKNEYCGCQMDTPNEEIEDYTECCWHKEMEVQE